MIAWLKEHLRTPLFMNSYLLIVMRALSAIFGFLFWALAARLMPETDVGLASGVMSATMLLSGLAQLGLGYGLTRHLAHTEQPNRLLNASIIVSSITSLILALLFLLLLEWWSPALLPLRANPLYMVCFVVLVMGWSLSSLLHWVFIATRRAVYSLTRQASHIAIAVVLLIVFQRFMPGFTSALLAHMVAALASVALSFQALPKAHPGYRFSVPWRDLFKGAQHRSFAMYSFINYISVQFSRIPDTVLPLLIINQFGPRQGAYFFIVWSIGRTISTAVGAVSESLFAEGSTNPAMASVFTLRAAKLSLLLTGGLALLVSLLGRWILSIYGQNYVEAGLGLLYFVAFASVPTVLLSLFTSLLRIRDRLMAMCVHKIINKGLGLLFIYVGIVYLGFVGAGMGWLISEILVLAGSLVWWQWQKGRAHKPQTVPVAEQAEVHT